MGLFGKKPEVTIKIEGMTCGHCVMSATKALESVPGVKKAVVSLENKEAKVTLSKEGAASNEVLIDAVVSAGYKASM